jgi:hypothetical protein
MARTALLAAHERALKRVSRMTAQEGFESLVKAGIYKSDGKLAQRYGGCVAPSQDLSQVNTK